MNHSAEITRTATGHALLNVGSGAVLSPEWTNIDLHAREHVIGHDIRRPLPFADASFDAVYSSHVLEHLTPEDGRSLLAEMRRVLVARGIIRVVVPDLEQIAREYVLRLETALEDGDPEAISRYRWMVLELIDQMVRTRPGGEMARYLRSDAVDADFVRGRGGEEFAPFLDPIARKADPKRPPLRRIPRALFGRVRRKLAPENSFAASGERHRWMYDRLSLSLLLADSGFAEIEVTSHLRSAIPGWGRYRLDSTADGKEARKPDSLFVEAVLAHP